MCIILAKDNLNRSVRKSLRPVLKKRNENTCKTHEKSENRLESETQHLLESRD